MKILIVTSQVTLVPKNYFAFIEALLNECTNSNRKDLHIEFAFLKNNEISFLFKALGLILLGSPRIGIQLLLNSFEAFVWDRRKQFLSKNQIPFHFFKSPNSKDFRDFIKNNQINILLNSRTRYIYHKKTLKHSNYLPLNIHHGILPSQRGLMCDLWAIAQKNEVGFSIHRMNEKIDEGEIYQVYNQSNFLIKQIQDMNYLHYIYESSKIEGKEAFKLLCSVEHLTPIENSSQNVIYFKNPTFKDIIHFKKIGMKL